VEEGARGVGCDDSASDESLLEEERQVEGRKRRSVRLWGFEPASHNSEYQVSSVRCQVFRIYVESYPIYQRDRIMEEHLAGKGENE